MQQTPQDFSNSTSVSEVHHSPRDWNDRLALRFVKLLRVFADGFFAKRYGHRAVVLETVAAVPGLDQGID